MSSDLKNVAEVQAVAEGNSLFSGALHGVLNENSPKNLIFSPFSLSAVVAMAKLGARGDTSDEIEKGLNFPSDNEVLSKGYSQVLASLQESNEGYTLAAANRMYSKLGFDLKQEFAVALKDSFGAEAQQLDFGNNVAAAEEINSWVEKVTNSKIKDLIPADALNALTRVVLVNGVYFKGLWKEKFENTEKAPFYLNETDTVKVNMMYKKAKFPHTDLRELNAQAVALPYKGDRLTMIIYLPRERTGLSKLEEGLKNVSPSKVLGDMHSSMEVEVNLPQFKIESTHSLVEPLKKLGVQTMFSRETADFSGIPESSIPLFVSEIVQKAFIEVNEEGSEAVAATGLMMRKPAMMMCLPNTIEFRADHPFHFQIVDRSTNFVLFAGSCKNPTA